MLKGTLIWEFGSRTMALTPEFARRLPLASPDPAAVDILDYRNQIVSPNRDTVYERLARSFQSTEPTVNLYTLKLASGGTAQVRSQSLWETDNGGTPARLVSTIEELTGHSRNELDDEFVERLIDLRFLAEKHGDPSYRGELDSMLQRVWRDRRND
ncbi:hypothetical protein [Aureimonas sp. ME7]|uniref:hypothetical protein n=1 Tax=Aureimonas sp. ME7 TaxID=2744252 RepID=UPI0015F39B33|nr:hypothetical protein [Aureimonas sp. ME7]